MVEWVTAFATFFAAVVALFLGFMPIWLDRKEKKTKANKLRKKIGTKAIDCHDAMKVLQRRLKSASFLNDLSSVIPIYLKTEQLIQELVASSDREDVLSILPPKDYEVLSYFMHIHSHLTTGYSIRESSSTANLLTMQAYTKNMAKALEQVQNMCYPKKKGAHEPRPGAK